MLATKHTKLLAIRLPEAQKRRIKSLAASLGLSLQDAVQQALEAWVSQHSAKGALSVAPLHDSPGGAAGEKPRRTAKRSA